MVITTFVGAGVPYLNRERHDCRDAGGRAMPGAIAEGVAIEPPGRGSLLRPRSTVHPEHNGVFREGTPAPAI